MHLIREEGGTPAYFDMVAKAMEPIPDNKHAIARFFLERGIKGQPRVSCGCVLARYLQRETGQSIYVGASVIMRRPHPGEYDILARIPAPMLDFTNAFDNFEYPELITGTTREETQ